MTRIIELAEQFNSGMITHKEFRSAFLVLDRLETSFVLICFFMIGAMIGAVL